MKAFAKGLFLFTVIILFISLITVSCRKKEPEKAIKPDYEEALVTFLSGEAFVLRAGDWVPIEIGNLLIKKDTIKVSENSFCELQFGKTAAVRIQENTIVELQRIFTGQGEADIGLKMVAGNVLYKVGKLTGDERFEIETVSTILGVRGTKFMVREEEGRETLLAVKEGEVSVLPSAIDINKMREKAEGGDEKIFELLARLESAALIVKPDQEITIEKAGLKRIEEESQGLEELFAAIAGETKPEIISEKLIALAQKLDGLLRTMSEDLLKPEEISEQTAGRLEEVEEIRMITMPAEVVKIFIKTVPGDAEIFLNGVLVGRGSISGVFNHEERLSFLVRREGYEEKTLDIVARKGEDREYKIELTALPGKPVQEEEIGVRVVPSDSEILLNGKPVGRGNFRGRFSVGEELSFLLRREGYLDKDLKLVVAAGSGKIYEITLEINPIARKYSVSETVLTGINLTADNKTVTIDGNGLITASDREGNPIQTIGTETPPSKNSLPALIGGKVYYIGQDEFIVADINSGEVIKRLAIENSAIYPFGRRVAELNNRGLFPDDDTMMIFDLDTGEITEKIKIPDGSIMSPAVYKNWALLVNKKGQLLIIDEEGGFVSVVPTGALKSVAVSSAVYNNLAFFAGARGTVVCVDLDEREVLWKKELSPRRETDIFQDLECGKEGVYIYSGNTLHALAPETGEALFAPLEGLSSPPLYDAGKLYFGTEDGFFRIYDAKTGKSLQSLDIKEIITARPRLQNGKILVGTEGGSIILINPSDRP